MNIQPNSSPAAKLHPIIWVAALAVIAASLVGIAAMTGMLPNQNKTAAPEPAPVAAAPVEAVPAPAPLPAAPTQKPASKPAAQSKPAGTTYSSKPAADDERKATTYQSRCLSCGIIEAITPVTQEGEGSGIGAVAGGVVGGVIGNQIGHGTTRDVARIAGIAGGAYAGHQIEKNQRSRTYYDIVVRMEDGSSRRIRQDNEPLWQPGDKVRVENGVIQSR